MLGQTRLNDLRSRKELLLVQADAQRRLIALEAQNAADSLRWADSIHRAWQEVKPLAWVAAPVAGFCLARYRRSVGRLGLHLFKAWRWISREFLPHR
jgi:hypothetical protein